MTVWTATVAIFLLLHVCSSSSVVPVPSDSDSTKTLEYYLCTEDGQQELIPGTILQLASHVPHVINQGQGCMLMNVTNVTITSIGLDTAIVKCHSHTVSMECAGLLFLVGQILPCPTYV